MEAIYKGKIRDKNGYAVHLFYEYRGHEYMITDEHNGYSETLATKHKIEQQRIDNIIKEKENNKIVGTDPMKALDLLYSE